jgi:hypothetical protein
MLHEGEKWAKEIRRKKERTNLPMTTKDDLSTTGAAASTMSDFFLHSEGGEPVGKTFNGLFLYRSRYDAG